jgi:hypothetical protein
VSSALPESFNRIVLDEDTYEILNGKVMLEKCQLGVLGKYMVSECYYIVTQFTSALTEVSCLDQGSNQGNAYI